MSSDKNKPSADRIALFKRLAKYSFEITDFERIREYGLELVGGWFSHNNQRCYLEFCTPPAYVKGNKQRINQLRTAGLGIYQYRIKDQDGKARYVFEAGEILVLEPVGKRRILK